MEDYEVKGEGDIELSGPPGSDTFSCSFSQCSSTSLSFSSGVVRVVYERHVCEEQMK